MGRDCPRPALSGRTPYFNPRAPYGARPEGGTKTPEGNLNFNPRAPYGARPSGCSQLSESIRFQSTRPVWGATLLKYSLVRLPRHFNPRAPYGARQHPTRPLESGKYISIHAPRMGRDFRFRPPGTRGVDFNPRAPYGARRSSVTASPTEGIFQSTRPVWGATHRKNTAEPRVRISIHAPRMGRDNMSIGKNIAAAHFNPRAPYGARHPLYPLRLDGRGISIHAPRMGRDTPAPPSWRTRPLFQSTRPVWGATAH